MLYIILIYIGISYLIVNTNATSSSTINKPSYDYTKIDLIDKVQDMYNILLNVNMANLNINKDKENLLSSATTLSFNSKSKISKHQIIPMITSFILKNINTSHSSIRLKDLKHSLQQSVKSINGYAISIYKL